MLKHLKFKTGRHGENELECMGHIRLQAFNQVLLEENIKRNIVGLKKHNCELLALEGIGKSL